MTDDDEHVEPIWIGDDTVLVGDAARQYRSAFAEKKTVPLRAGDSIIGTAQLQPDGTVHCVVTDPAKNNWYDNLFRIDAVSIGPIPGADTEVTIIPPTEVENP